jgi:hypothetical protein
VKSEKWYARLAEPSDYGDTVNVHDIVEDLADAEERIAEELSFSKALAEARDGWKDESEAHERYEKANAERAEKAEYYNARLVVALDEARNALKIALPAVDEHGLNMDRHIVRKAIVGCDASLAEVVNGGVRNDVAR